MPKKVFIHVGFHKTGTTAIQQSLFSHSEELKKAGFQYATNKRRANHRQAWALTERYWGWKNRGGKKTPISEWTQHLKILKSKKYNSILSSEFFSELNDVQLDRLAADLKNFQVEVIFTIRPLNKILASSYQQYLKYGIKASYEEWLRDIFQNTGKSKLTPTFWKRHQHDIVIARWAKAFGSQNIHLVVVDESEPDFLFDTFNEILQLPAGTLSEVEDLGTNRSLNFAEISLLLAINKAFPKERNWADYELFIREGSIRHLTNKVDLARLSEKLLTPQWAVDESSKITANSIKEIDALGVRIYGDISKLTMASIPVGVNSEISDIPIETVVNAMLAFEKSKVIKKYSSKEIFQEAKNRMKRIIKRYLPLT
jgi:hypothetical protein